MIIEIDELPPGPAGIVKGDGPSVGTDTGPGPPPTGVDTGGISVGCMVRVTTIDEPDSSERV